MFLPSSVSSNSFSLSNASFTNLSSISYAWALFWGNLIFTNKYNLMMYCISWIFCPKQLFKTRRLLKLMMRLHFFCRLEELERSGSSRRRLSILLSQTASEECFKNVWEGASTEDQELAHWPIKDTNSWQFIFTLNS